MSSSAKRNALLANDSDEDLSSLASNQDEDKSYAVETIWAERVSKGHTEYLIKWEGYPAERATWEPVEMFDDELGHHEPFDLRSWEEHCEKLKRDRNLRRERRQRREMRMSSEQLSADLVESHTLTQEPRAPLSVNKGNSSTLPGLQNRVSFSRNSGVSQILPELQLPESHTCRKQPPASDVADSNKRQRLGPPQLPIQRAPQSAPTHAAPYTPLPDIASSYTYPHQWKHEMTPALTFTTSNKPASTFGERGMVAKAGPHPRFRGEPAPDITKLDIIRPSQFPERTGRPDTDASNLPFTIRPSNPPLSRDTGDSRQLPLPPAQPSPGCSGPRKQTFRDKVNMSKSTAKRRRSLEENNYKPSDIFARRESPARRRSRSRSADFLRSPKPSNISAVAKNTWVNPRPVSPVDFSQKSQLARMPKRTPGSDARTIPGGYWFGPGEVLMMTSFGIDEGFVGNTRACGLLGLGRDLIKNKSPGKLQLDIHFNFVCKIDEIMDLRDQHTVSLRTGWIEGFDKTNKPLLRVAEFLRTNDLVAVFFSETKKRLAWVVSSRFSRNSEWTHWLHNDQISNVPSGVPILLTACENLSLCQPRIPGARNHTFSIRESGLKNTFSSLGPQLQTETQSAQPFLAHQTEQVPSPSRKLALESSESTSDLSTPVTGTDPLTTAQLNGLRQHFTTGRLNSADLTITKENGQRLEAKKFYLACSLDDEDALAELEIMEMIYAEQGVVSLTNQSPDHWASFVNDNQQGVVIFHESFQSYGLLRPPIAQVNKKFFNFWVVRLTRPLEFPDTSLIAASPHVQQILTPGAAMVLITKDAMSKLMDVAIVLRWIFRCQRKKPRKWKIVFFPGILQWITERLNDTGFAKDHRLLRVIESLIMRNNIDYPPTQVFDPSSLDFLRCIENKTSTVIELPYTEDRTDENSAIADDSERDADYLIEMLASEAKMKFRPVWDCYCYRIRVSEDTGFEGPMGEPGAYYRSLWICEFL
ncbi:uncharacterized protein N7511_008244 [Penicillium nucicola]|uniref:uncharacterized protein n=1 Tax=Penicillium nucicola TaxID=1850975 RepID=UPI0025452587|nr:uncharacterized protein N7511_008244 [Penicillium nucicola]KAJ5754091.1 hypothetical protein N7511_008244 [Penicillium nucicola]